MAHFLRQLRHSSRSRAPARSLLSFLASSKLHPFCGKNQSYPRIVKFIQSLIFARRMSHFLRPVRHSSRSRAPARSLLSFLASSKLHPFCGKKRLPKALKGMALFRLQHASKQYPTDSRKTPYFAGFQRSPGQSPLVGSK